MRTVDLEERFRLAAAEEQLKGRIDMDAARNTLELANLFLTRANHAQAERLYFKALEVSQRLSAGRDEFAARALGSLARLYDALERYEEAERFYNWSFETKTRLYGITHRESLEELRHLIWVCEVLGKHGQANEWRRFASQYDAAAAGVGQDDCQGSLAHRHGRESERPANMATSEFSKDIAMSSPTGFGSHQEPAGDGSGVPPGALTGCKLVGYAPTGAWEGRNQENTFYSVCRRLRCTLACLEQESTDKPTIMKPGLWRALRRLVCWRCEPPPMPLSLASTEEWMAGAFALCRCENPHGLDGMIIRTMHDISQDFRQGTSLALSLAAAGRHLILASEERCVSCCNPAAAKILKRD